MKRLRLLMVGSVLVAAMVMALSGCEMLMSMFGLGNVYSDQGSLSAPFIVGGMLSSGEVSRTSYYKSMVTVGNSYTVKLDGLSDNVDLAVFSDSSFSNLLGSSSNPGTAIETVTKTASSIWLYFKVDSAASNGATFHVSVVDNGPVGGGGTVSEGTVGSPIVLSGSHSGSVAGSGSSYYIATTAPGFSYTVTVSGMTADADLYVYSDVSFATSLGSSTNTGTTPDAVTVTASGLHLYIKVYGYDSAGSSFTITATEASEGTIGSPLAIGDASTGQLISTGRYNNGTDDSYYVVTVTPYSTTNRVQMTGLSADLDVYVYSDPGFTTQIGYSNNSANANEDTTATLIDAGTGYLYIKIIPYTGGASTFTLTVN